MSPKFVWRAPAGRVVLAFLPVSARRSAASASRPSTMPRSTTGSRSNAPSTGPRLHVWKRPAALAVAIALLALPVSVLAEHLEDETAEHVSDILITTVTDPAYVWNGRLADSYSAPFDAPLSTSTFVWDPAEQAAMVRDHFLLEHDSE